jgi:hypothetical protein
MRRALVLIAFGMTVMLTFLISDLLWTASETSAAVNAQPSPVIASTAPVDGPELLVLSSSGSLSSQISRVSVSRGRETKEFKPAVAERSRTTGVKTSSDSRWIYVPQF